MGVSESTKAEMIMKKIIALMIFILITMFSWKSFFTGGQSQVPERGKSQISISLIESISIDPPVKGVAYNFEFTRDHRLWNSVDWNNNKSPRYISFSQDFGKSWTPVRVPVNTGTISTIVFTDSDNGWIAFQRVLIRTLNGGGTWQKILLPHKSEINEIIGITFSDSKKGYLVGSSTKRERGSGTESPGMEILCTENGGATWGICFKTNEYDLAQKIISSDSIAVVMLWQKGLLVSNDNGRTWLNVNVNFPIRDIVFGAKERIWAVASDSSLRYSDDSGQTWQSAQINTQGNYNVHWKALTFDEKKKIGVVIGTNGEVGLSTDSGNSWDLFSDIMIGDEPQSVRISYPFFAVLGEKNLYIFKIISVP